MEYSFGTIFFLFGCTSIFLHVCMPCIPSKRYFSAVHNAHPKIGLFKYIYLLSSNLLKIVAKSLFQVRFLFFFYNLVKH